MSLFVTAIAVAVVVKTSLKNQRARIQLVLKKESRVREWGKHKKSSLSVAQSASVCKF